jgi:uncharacterized protein YjiS (DUF1127 family)
MRWLVHALARLAIAATFTNSAAALDAQVERGKCPSSANSLWEHLMLGSSESANGVARRHNVPSREFRFDLRDNSGATRETRAQTPRLDLADVNSPLAVMPAMTRGDRQDTAVWSPMFTFFMEGFALYGASFGSYGAFLYATATSPAESCPAEASAPQPKEMSSRERRSFIVIVSSNPGVTGSKPENDTDRNGRGSGAPSENTGLAGFCGSPSFDRDRSNHRNWLTKPWIAIASRWAHWRREREIKKAVDWLAKLDDQTLRDIGIPHRSQIEQVVRYCRDC